MTKRDKKLTKKPQKSSKNEQPGGAFMFGGNSEKIGSFFTKKRNKVY